MKMYLYSAIFLICYQWKKMLENDKKLQQTNMTKGK